MVQIQKLPSQRQNFKNSEGIFFEFVLALFGKCAGFVLENLKSILLIGTLKIAAVRREPAAFLIHLEGRAQENNEGANDTIHRHGEGRGGGYTQPVFEDS